MLRGAFCGSMMMVLGRDSSGVIYADSSFALAIVRRKGAGQLHHINDASFGV